jgi:multiple sugar transport system permease protein
MAVVATTATGPQKPPPVGRRPARNHRSALRTAGYHLVAATVSLVWFAPLALVVVTAFRTFDDVAANGLASIPEALSLDGFSGAWTDGGMSTATLNSFIITIPALLLSIGLSACAAFGLSRYQVPFRRTILLIMLAGNLLPPQIMLIPLNRIMETTGLFDTYTAIVILHVTFGLGFYTFVLYGFMRSLPNEIQQAAVIDGASALQIFWRIVLPLSRPALAATTALGFTFIFNDLLWSITVLRSDTRMPVTPTLLGLQGAYLSDYTLLSAGTVIAAIPTLIVFLVFQRYFVDGLTLGAVK